MAWGSEKRVGEMFKRAHMATIWSHRFLAPLASPLLPGDHPTGVIPSWAPSQVVSTVPLRGRSRVLLHRGDSLAGRGRPV